MSVNNNVEFRLGCACIRITTSLKDANNALFLFDMILYENEGPCLFLAVIFYCDTRTQVHRPAKEVRRCGRGVSLRSVQNNLYNI